MKMTEEELKILQKDYACPNCNGEVFLVESDYGFMFFCEDRNCRTEGLVDDFFEKRA
jgi:ssDNA-binding Zn-finger/Zn-ribbon topoisomerase 1